MRLALCVGTLVVVSSTTVAAQTVTSEDEYAKRLGNSSAIEPLSNSLAGEEVSLYTGATAFSIVDVAVPGNDALPVELRRRLTIEDPGVYKGALGGIGEWSLDVPYIHGIFAEGQGWKVIGSNPDARCTTQAIPNTSFEGSTPGAYSNLVWDGYYLNIPGQGDNELLKNNRNAVPAAEASFPWVTTARQIVGCLPSARNYPGEGFVVRAPDGTSYTFDYVISRQASSVSDVSRVRLGFGGGATFSTIIPRVHMYMMATKTEDRFGNSVNYEYVGTELRRIYASDGREIILNWTAGNLTSVVANGRTWSYSYRNGLIPYGTSAALDMVTLPDGSSWRYSVAGELRKGAIFRDDGPAPTSLCQFDVDRAPGSDFTYTIVSPSGAKVDFLFSYSARSRTRVPTTCQETVGAPRYPDVNAVFYQWALVKKTLAGPGLMPAEWTYGYGSTASGTYYRAPWPKPDFSTLETYIPGGDCANCSVSGVLRVSEPGRVVDYEYGAQYAVNEGRLLSKTVRQKGTLAVVSKEIYQYLPDSQISAQPFADNIGRSLLPIWERPMAARQRPVVVTYINQDGVTFSKAINAFDSFMRPVSVTESNTPTP